jgi:hypothetical protein
MITLLCQGRCAVGRSGRGGRERIVAQAGGPLCASVKEVFARGCAKALNGFFRLHIVQIGLHTRAEEACREFAYVDPISDFFTVRRRRMWRRRRRWLRRSWRIESTKAVSIDIPFACCSRRHIRIVEIDAIQTDDVRTASRDRGAGAHIERPAEMCRFAFTFVLREVNNAVVILLDRMRLDGWWCWKWTWRRRGRRGWWTRRWQCITHKELGLCAKGCSRGDISIGIDAQPSIALVITVK